MKLRAALVAAVVLAGCASSAESNERPLTLNEAATLAQALATNMQRGGALFRIATLTEPGGVEMYLDGVVDWQRHAGSATIESTDGSVQATRIWWTPRRVGERRPSLDDLITGATGVVEPIIFRPVDLGRRLDQVAAVVSALATATPENAQIILQTEGSVFVRIDRLRDREVLVLRYGPRSVYWIDTETGVLMRFEGSDASGSLPIVVDLLELGVHTIDLPPSERLVRPEALGEVGRLVTEP